MPDVLHGEVYGGQVLVVLGDDDQGPAAWYAPGSSPELGCGGF
jgi:hypothetical protein